MDTDVSPAAKLRSIGVSVSYASEIANGVRKPSLKLAVRIWRETGLKYGVLAGKPDDVLDAAFNAHEEAAQ